jgi:hypothetical protein
MIDVNDGTKHLVFHIIGQSHMVHFLNSLSGIHFIITWEGFDQAIKTIKN